MIVAVQGTDSFSDYNVFLRAISVALSGMREDDKDFIIYSIGPSKVNSFVSEFSNLSERGMKARGKRIKFYKAPSYWIEKNMNIINYFAFLSNEKQPLSKLVKVAEDNNVEVGIFRY
jgi:hypothetical protein